MLNYKNVVRAGSLEEAYEVYSGNLKNVLLGGTNFLRIGNANFETAVDLSDLGLRYIKDNGNEIEMGAYTTYRDLETDELTKGISHGVIPKALSQVLGVQFRNSVTIGASLASRYGFSDSIPVFLALKTEIELVKGGRMTLSDYLDMKPVRDILSRVFIPKSDILVSYEAMRNSASDFPVLNAAVSYENKEWKVIIGARTGKAVYCPKAGEFLTKEGWSEENAAKAGEIASEEVQYSQNGAASAEYRKMIAPVLVKRCISEVKTWL
ncbi:MAG: FAD binding domain-containing protein [Clostridiaceae bacterium]